MRFEPSSVGDKDIPKLRTRKMAPTKESRRGHKSFSPRAGEAGGVRLKLDRDGVPIAPFSSGKGSSLNAPIKSHSPHGEDAGAYSSIPFAAVLRIFCHGSELKTPFRGCRAYLQASQTDASDMSRCNEPGETVLQRSGRWGDCVEAKAPLRCRKCKGHARLASMVLDVRRVLRVRLYQCDECGELIWDEAPSARDFQ